MTANTENLKQRGAIKIKCVGNARKFGSSDGSDYKIKRHTHNKSYWKKYPIKLCTNLTAKLLITLYKSKIIILILDEDLLQRRIYFLTFI